MRNTAIAAAAAAIVGLIASAGAVFAAANLNVSPNGLTFTGVALGTTSAPQTVTIKNGGAAIHIGGFALSNGFNAINDKCSGTNLAPRANCTVGVTFTASKKGTVEGELSVETGATSPPVPLSLLERGNATRSSAMRSPFPEGEATVLGVKGLRGIGGSTEYDV
ncbi:MAG: choice-of-anchor D domain-containing protein [Candidatus Binataceae bacterium]